MKKWLENTLGWGLSPGGKLMELIDKDFDLSGGVTNWWDSATGKVDKDNLQFQKDMWEDQKELDNTAVQRRADDMEAAGLSKTLAAGGGASGVTMGNAPQKSNEIQDSKMRMLMGLMTAKANIAKTAAETALTKTKQKQIGSLIEGQKYDNVIKQAEAALRTDRFFNWDDKEQKNPITWNEVAISQLHFTTKQIEQQFRTGQYQEYVNVLKKNVAQQYAEGWAKGEVPEEKVQAIIEYKAALAAAELIKSNADIKASDLERLLERPGALSTDSGGRFSSEFQNAIGILLELSQKVGETQ